VSSKEPKRRVRKEANLLYIPGYLKILFMFSALEK
jgi:hypothetical protein